MSIIVPTYNAEKTIEKTIETLLNQTYDNIEIICCDDCSKDSTYSILKKIAKKDSRVTVFQNEKNSKAAFTRNFAISKSKGIYVVQSDDDDYYDLEKIKKQVEFLENNPEYDFVGTNAYIYDKSGIWGEWIVKQYPQKEDFLSTNPFINTSLMFRRDAIDSMEVFYRVSKDTRRGQDYDLMMRMYIAGKKGSSIQENLSYYQRDNDYGAKIKYRDRYGEFKFRYGHFRKLGLMPKGYLYAVKPLVVGLIPYGMLGKYHREKLKSN